MRASDYLVWILLCMACFYTAIGISSSSFLSSSNPKILVRLPWVAWNWREYWVKWQCQTYWLLRSIYCSTSQWPNVALGPKLRTLCFGGQMSLLDPAGTVAWSSYFSHTFLQLRTYGRLKMASWVSLLRSVWKQRRDNLVWCRWCKECQSTASRLPWGHQSYSRSTLTRTAARRGGQSTIQIFCERSSIVVFQSCNSMILQTPGCWRV